LTVFVLLVAGVAAALDLSYERVHYIDSESNPVGGQNHLFRGPLPLSDGSFDDANLRSYIMKQGLAVNLPIPLDFYLIVITLNQLEDNSTIQESIFFDSQPSHGELVVWPVSARYPSPLNLSSDDRAAILSNPEALFGRDYVPARVEELSDMLSHFVPPSGANTTVIYIHDNSGCDRLGTITGAYRMRYLNDTFMAVDNINTQLCGRDLNDNTRAAEAWFCLFRQMQTQGLYDCQLPGPSTNDTVTPVYAAAFLESPSSALLCATYPPIHVHEYCDHMTIAFLPTPDQLLQLQSSIGITFVLKVVGYGQDDRGQAVVVQSSIVNLGQEVTHVTVSTRNDTSPVYSNDMLKTHQTPVPNGISLKATVGLFLSNNAIAFRYPF